MNDILELTERWMKVLGAVSLMGMATITMCDIVMRYFGFPIFGSKEMVAFLGALAIGFTLPYAHRQKSHIGVEILVRFFPPKLKRSLFLITDIVTAAFFILVTVRLFIYANKERLAKTVSLDLEFPEYLIITVLSFCFFVFVLFVLKDIVLKLKGDN